MDSFWGGVGGGFVFIMRSSKAKEDWEKGLSYRGFSYLSDTLFMLPSIEHRPRDTTRVLAL